MAGAVVYVPLGDQPPHCANIENSLHTRTNENGRYLIDGIPAGQKIVVADHPDYYLDVQTIEIITSQTVELNFNMVPQALGSQALTVMVIDVQTSNALQGAGVHLALNSIAEPGSTFDLWHKLTDENGKVTFERLPQRELTVIASLSGYETSAVSISPSEFDSIITIALTPNFDDLQTSTKWYFADGDTSEGYETFLLTVNPDETETATLALTVLFEDQEPLIVVGDVAPLSRYTFNLGQILDEEGLEPTAFAMELCSDNGIPVYAERAIYWSGPNGPREGGSDSAGATELSTEWFLAEGTTTNERETIILIGNPNEETAELEVTYLVEGADPIIVNYTVAAERRLTINASEDVPSVNFSTQVNSVNGVGIVVERTMFGPADGVLQKWGHNSPGVTETSSVWYLAEGALHSNYETFLLCANPTDQSVPVTIRFLRSANNPVVRQETLAPRSRRTINVEAAYPEMIDEAGFSIVVETDNGAGIVCERAMYWRSDGYTDRSGATAVVGCTSVHSKWYLAEGAAWGSSGFENFILCGNPMATDAEVTVTFVQSNGQSIDLDFTIPAGRRLTVKANDYLPGDAGTQSVSTIVESTNGVGLVVERAMYWNGRIEGHASSGIPAIK